MSPLVIGLTGSIGSGKSTVLSMFRELGHPCSDADQLAREVTKAGSPGLREVAAEFGDDLLSPDGTLNRRRLATIVFSDPAALARLEAIIHPRVIAAQREFIRSHAGSPLVVLDIPLLFESGADKFCDRTVTVVVREDVRRDRLQRRTDGLTGEELDKRLQAQMPQEEKARRSSAVIDNNGPLESTRRQVETLVDRWLATPPRTS